MGQSIAPLMFGSAFTNMLTASMSASSQASLNRQMMGFNARENQKNRDWQQQMYNQEKYDQMNFYNMFQSPQAVARQLSAIGLNPTSVMSQGSGIGASPVSMPSFPSGSAASVSGLQNPDSYYQQAIDSTTKMIDSISNSYLREKQALNVISQTQGQEFANKIAAFNAYLTEKYGENEKIQGIRNLVADVALKTANKDYTDAQKTLSEIMQKIQNKELDIKDEEYSQLLINGSFLVQQLTDLHNLNLAKIGTEKSQQSFNYAGAKLSNEQALTVKELRGWQAGFEQARTEIAQTESFVKRNTLWEQCESYLAELRAKKMLPDQVEQAIRKAKKENDWFEINELLGVVDTGTKVAGTYYGAKTGQGFVRAQDTRNEIQSQYNQYLYNKDNEAYKVRRTAVAGSGHYWGQDY